MYNKSLLTTSSTSSLLPSSLSSPSLPTSSACKHKTATLKSSLTRTMDFPRVLHLGCPYYLSKNCNINGYDLSTSSSTISPSPLTIPSSNSFNSNNGHPRLGTTIPNRIFVGGLSTDTTEAELQSFFSNYGNITAVKIINDRSGVPKGSLYRYGFVTFESEEEARRVLKEADNLQLKGRKLNIAIAIKKSPIRLDGVSLVANGPLFYPQNTVPLTTFVNDNGPNYAFAGKGLYPLNMPPSANSIGSTYPVVFPQPIYFAQQQTPFPHPHCSYPKLETMQMPHPQPPPVPPHHHHHHHFQGTVPTSSYQPSIPYPVNAAAAAAAAAYIQQQANSAVNNGGPPPSAGPWRWPPINECFPIVNVNQFVGLNK